MKAATIYALRALQELARRHHGGARPKEDLVAVSGAPPAEAEGLLAALGDAGLVETTREERVMLARDPARISVGEVLRLLEGRGALFDCIEQRHLCDPGDGCSALEVWTELGIEAVIASALDRTSLAELAARNARSGSPRPTPAATRRPGGKRQVLIVEDEGELLESMAAALTQRGFAVKAVTSGEEAMRQIRNSPRGRQLK